MSIGEQLKTVIRQSGELQSKVAAETGIHHSGISRFLSGKRGLDLTSIEKLAKYFRLELRQTPPATKRKSG